MDTLIAKSVECAVPKTQKESSKSSRIGFWCAVIRRQIVEPFLWRQWVGGYFKHLLYFHIVYGILGALKKVIREGKNQLDATQCFIELVICSTCFGLVYAHHQELATILLLRHVACNSWLLVVGRSGSGQKAMRPEWGMLFNCSRTTSLNPDA